MFDLVTQSPEQQTFLPRVMARSFWTFERIGCFASLVVGILGVALAIYIYFQSIERPEPTYLIHEGPAQIYSQTDTSPQITVLDADGNVIDGNIYLATATFWNSGNVGIESAEIRQPVEFRLSPVARIIDFRITRQTYPDIANFQLSLVPPSDQSANASGVQLTWAHLDPQFAAEIQIIYEAVQPADIEILGHLYRVPAEQFREVPNTYRTANRNFWVIIFVSAIVLGSTLMFLWMSYIVLKFVRLAMPLLRLDLLRKPRALLVLLLQPVVLMFTFYFIYLLVVSIINYYTWLTFDMPF